MITDLSFSYKYLLRFVLIHKYGMFKNKYTLPFCSLGKLFVLFNNVQNINSTLYYGYFYLFRFFFGRLAFVTNFQTRFKLGKYYYTFCFSSIIRKQAVYFPIHLFFNDFKKVVSNTCSKSYCKINCSFIYSITDMHIFIEVKNNASLLKLPSTLYLKLYTSVSDPVTSSLLLTVFKLPI